MYLLSGIIDFFNSINGIFYVIAYLVGGIPFGVLYTKILGVNLREIGSGSIGATNVLRALKQTNPSLAKRVAILTGLSDAIKGLVVILIAKFFGLSYETQWAIAFFALLGHCYSPFLKLEGGKGVATMVGCVVVFMPIVAIVGLIVWFVVGKLLKISSIASLLGVLSGTILSFFIYADVPHIHTHTPIVLMAFIVFYKHIPNIIRLIQKKESKII